MTVEDWIICRIEDGKFEGWGGVGNISEGLKIFRDWAEGSSENA